MKIALLDGYNLMHRARFGMKDGDHHIVFNFFRSLRPIIAEIKPDKVYLVLEGVPLHRIEADSAYKANRVIEEGTAQADEMAEFRRQKRIILEALGNFPITLAKHPQLECDDTIASLCVDVHKDDDCVVVSTTQSRRSMSLLHLMTTSCGRLYAGTRPTTCHELTA